MNDRIASFDWLGMGEKSGDGSHLLNYPIDRCYWATAGGDQINWHMGYRKSEPNSPPGWSLMSRLGRPPSDFAMRIKGVPLSEYVPSTELESFEVVHGRRLSGGLDDLVWARDGTVVKIQSRGAVRLGQRYNVIAMNTTHQCLVDSPDVLDVAVTADVQGLFLIPKAHVYLRNWSTGQFDEVGVYDIYVENVTWPLHDIPAWPYVNDEGKVEVKFEVWSGPLTHVG